jgi:hypothetical protein
MSVHADVTDEVAADQRSACATSAAVSSILLEDAERDAIIVREFGSTMSDGLD